LTESQQYRLCLDLLDEGYKVYITDNQAVIAQVKDYLGEKYGGRVILNDVPTEDVYCIEL